MALTNPTSLVNVEKLGRFKQHLDTILLQTVKQNQLITNSDGTHQYTVSQLLQAMADLMDKAVVVNPDEEQV